MVGFLTVKVEGYIQQEKEARMIHALKDSAGDNRTKSYLPLYKQMLHREIITGMYTYMCVCSVAWLYLSDTLKSVRSSVHGIFQSRILEWVAISSFRGSFQPRDGTHVSMCLALADGFSTTAPPENLTYGLIYAYKFPC